MTGRLNRKICRAASLVLLLLLLSVPAYAQQADLTSSDAFDCHIVDRNGQTINGYFSEEDNIWYLFVPSTEEISTLTLYTQGEVTSVSTGVLDTQTGTITGAFADGREVLLTCGGEQVQVVAMQSDLPSLHIVLADTTLAEIHLDKDKKHKENSVYLSDPKGEYDLVVEGSVEMKGRGNSTWDLFDKKGYQIKFDSKTSVMGMGKAKKWVLLANACDDSMMRTQLTYQTASQMDMTFVPSFEYIDLWIDGEYRGTYILGEKIELGSSRLDLEDPKGVLFEHDEGFYHEEDYWFLSEYLQRHFALKESVSEDDEAVVLSAIDEFSAAVNEFAGYLYSTPSEQVTLEELSAMIDVDSFIRYYLINEYVLNHESFVSSFYWYKDGSDDVIHLGPIWDFDTCMGNEGSTYWGTGGDKHILFRYLLASPEFYARTQELKAAYMPLLAEMDSLAVEIFGEIQQSAAMNYLRWNILGQPNPKGGNDFCDTYEGAVNALKTWLEGRERVFSVPATSVVTSTVSADCGEMEIHYAADQDYDSVCFAVWSQVDGTDDKIWYDGRKDSNGVWTCTADLSRHNSFGLYEIVAYTGNRAVQLASGCNYVEQYGVWIESSVSADCTTMELILKDTTASHTQVKFAVWSAQEDQDDLQWYTAACNAQGQWVCTVDLATHASAGLYHVHAYSQDGTNDEPIATAYVYVGPPDLTVQLSADRSTLEVNLEYVLDPTLRVWFAIWSEANGQDDLVWYEMQKQTDTTWSADADINETGKYLIHVYTGENTCAEMLTNTSVVVENPTPQLDITVSADGTSMELVLNNASDWVKVWIPVWSEASGQDDIVWYRPVKQADGTWTCTAQTSESGVYVVHVYGGATAPTEVLTDTKVDIVHSGGSVPAPVLPEIEVVVSADGTSMELIVTNASEYAKVWIPVWSEANGQDDIVWYRPVKQADGTWTCTARTSESGVYVIHVYGGVTSPTDILTDTKVDIVPSGGSAPVPVLPEIEVVVSADGTSMELVLTNASEYAKVWIPVWSEANGQDDIVWYRPVKQADGTWTCTVQTSESGVYVIHVYGGVSSPTDILTDTKVEVTGEGGNTSGDNNPKLTVSLSSDGQSLNISLENAEDIPTIWIPVWSEANGQDDVVWYRPVKDSTGVWNCTVDLTKHGSNGIYNIHVYGGVTRPTDMLAHTTIEAEQVEQPATRVTATVNKENETMTIVLESKDVYERVWIPVWSDENGQDDIVWYQPTYNGTRWSVVVDLKDHVSSGTYHIHVYSGKNVPETVVAHTMAQV